LHRLAPRRVCDAQRQRMQKEALNEWLTIGASWLARHPVLIVPRKRMAKRLSMHTNLVHTAGNWADAARGAHLASRERIKESERLAASERAGLINQRAPRAAAIHDDRERLVVRVAGNRRVTLKGVVCRLAEEDGEVLLPSATLLELALHIARRDNVLGEQQQP
jgi:hypothetical protein